ncbi:MAG TPA: hypothetical protein DET40_20420 [Lentisphaeria bacterium]|nr:MAG: hypothetical protein A2X45_16345 [Lentisphaerae bacterium GWF2_50_93]HCE45917.1 hypothetical protein [Lentisphaeria bacterium]
MKRKDFKIGFPSSPTQKERQMGIWLISAGNFNTRDHVLKSRNFEQSLLIYCLDGVGSFRLGETTYKINAGDIFYIPAHFTHGYECDPAIGWNIKWMHFSGSYAENLLRIAGFSAVRPVRRIGQNRQIINCFDKLYRILKAKRMNYSFDATRTFLDILFELIKVSEPQDMTRHLLESVTLESANLEAAAKQAGYSKFHFSRLFKKATGVSPWTYAVSLKLDKAKELLMNSDVSVKEVALTVGISDPNYFTRIFAKYAGMSPVKYRNVMSER